MTKSNKSLASDGVVLALGVFDGVHLGHQEIINQLKRCAQLHNSSAEVISFHPHPREIVAPESSPKLLISPESRVERLLASGADRVHLVEFTPALAAKSPLEFLDTLLSKFKQPLRGICVGEHWRFGCKATGDATMLTNFAQQHQLEFNGVKEVEMAGDLVSSSRIRELIKQGELELATTLLGCYPTLAGQVETGLQIGGSKLKTPTANLRHQYGILPPDGVYAGFAKLSGGQRFIAAINIGMTPTVRQFGTDSRRIEAHLLDFSGNIYEEKLEIELVKFIRPERCFESLAELKKQIDSDVAAINVALGGK